MNCESVIDLLNRRESIPQDFSPLSVSEPGHELTLHLLYFLFSSGLRLCAPLVKWDIVTAAMAQLRQGPNIP